MKIAIAGGSGFLGTPLVRRLLSAGHDVVVLSRNPAKVEAGRGVAWHPPAVDGAWACEVASADAVVSLAGESIGDGRWTEARKQRLISSRLDSTQALVEAIRREPERQRAFVSASAVGFYGLRDDEALDEHSTRGSGFLAALCETWEAAARQAEPISRLVVLRFGVVLDESGGALGKMLLPFKLGAGGPIGTGLQWMSWVDLEDVLRVIEWVLADQSASGVYNVTAPEPVRNAEFGRALGRALHRPAFMPAPGFALRLVFGEMADEILLRGQRVLPARLQEAGFTFRQRTIDRAFARIFGSKS